MAMATLLAAAPAGATGETPKAADVLFEAKHIADVKPGTELVYKFERKASDETQLGQNFSDDIKIKIESENPSAPGKKNVLVQVYSGDRARDPQRITDMDGNPMVVIYLDNAVAHFMQVAGGDHAYLKNTFSKMLGKDSKVDPVTIDYKGDKVPGYRITVVPYANDPAKAKMQGYEGATFTIDLSDKIPGYLAKMVSLYKNSGKGAPTLEETTTLDGVGGVQ